mmetsp:Transcript_505/g.1133  ORF Transcript_505/g.1133 Transcript_505/m.1133 type:complete len:200 (+) Transcript_505:644-1243(+)
MAARACDSVGAGSGMLSTARNLLDLECAMAEGTICDACGQICASMLVIDVLVTVSCGFVKAPGSEGLLHGSSGVTKSSRRPWSCCLAGFVTASVSTSPTSNGGSSSGVSARSPSFCSPAESPTSSSLGSPSSKACSNAGSLDVSISSGARHPALDVAREPSPPPRRESVDMKVSASPSPSLIACREVLLEAGHGGSSSL